MAPQYLILYKHGVRRRRKKEDDNTPYPHGTYNLSRREDAVTMV